MVIYCNRVKPYRVGSCGKLVLIRGGELMVRLRIKTYVKKEDNRKN